MAFSDAPQCTAIAKTTGKRCKNAAMTGMTKCRFHGGKSTGAPIKSGLYATKANSGLNEKIERSLALVDPLDLQNELALARGMLLDFREKLVDGIITAGNREHVMDMIETIARVVNTIVRIRNDTALTAAEIQYVVVRIAYILEKYVPDPALRDAGLAELRGDFPAAIGDRAPRLVESGAVRPD